ncbi:glycosyl hydrolase family 95 catalytic domain-containing protein [Sphingobacterium deserti]|uniref:Alpha-L-fucosidase n=1 Tax=Sphingobacterium deserti TaxID=1229276 RepID=A0A0B8T3F0_9SPHI|nr:glycoside hydrolase N-terminal domain-containing protein [Sphingobacterium deserti]KGE16062.1 alpha-L-fucosidase [Sphingobacterium deserti]
MSDRRIRLLLIITATLLLQLTVAAQDKFKLFYDSPAADWNAALPLGNGRLGAMVFGGTAREEIQLNEETIWAGEPGNNVPKGKRGAIQEIRDLLAAGKAREAQALSNEAFPRAAPKDLDYGMPYQTFGSLFLDFAGHDQAKDYYRELDIENAVARTTYNVGGISYSREMFTSFEDDVVVIRLTASKPKSLSFKVSLNSPHKEYRVVTREDDLVLSGNSGSFDRKIGKVQFEGAVRPVLDGGKLRVTDDALEIREANAVTLYVSIATNFKKYNDLSGDASGKMQTWLDKAAKRRYEKALAAHVKLYKQQFGRVTLNLGTSAQALKTTDRRIQEFATAADPQLVALYFQFGRYLLISSSQPGGQPANLQGIWNHKLNPPWDSKYTVNINTEMNYWPAEVTNLSETHEPLFSMLEDLTVTGKESAEAMYGARGWVMHHNTDLWRITGVVDGGFYGMWPMGGAWLSQHIWQHYLYNGDRDFLSKYYPVLKGKALYYLDVLHKDRSGQYLILSPSISPENTYMDGGVGVSGGTTMDNQLIFDVFHNFLQAAETLTLDDQLRDSVRQSLAQLAPMQIGQHTQLQEWLEDLDRKNDKHRHISHLYGLYPAGQISPFRNPELTEAALNSLTYRGDKSTGWSMGWKVNWWARLLDGNRSYKLIQDQLSPPEGEIGQGGGTYPNLLDAHPPFQIDGNFGCTAGIAEMLLQSYDGNIYLLPALPDALPNGKVTGLKARGGFIIDLAWQDGAVTDVKIHSTLGGNCRLRLPKELVLKGNVDMTEAVAENSNPFYKVNAIKKPLLSDKATLKGIALPDTYLVDFETRSGKDYVFTAE